MLQILNSKRRNYPQRNVQMAIATLILALVGVVAVVAVWRGLWGLMDIYLLARQSETQQLGVLHSWLRDSCGYCRHCNAYWRAKFLS
jgi:cell division protein FtsB